jgi:hypothetical protein
MCFAPVNSPKFSTRLGKGEEDMGDENSYIKLLAQAGIFVVQSLLGFQPEGNTGKYSF